VLWSEGETGEWHRSGRQFDRKPGGTRQYPSRGNKGATRTNVQNDSEVEEFLSLLEDTS